MLPRCLVSPAQAQARRRSDVVLRRYLRSSPQRRFLVGPPDPVSNLRPVIYDEDENVGSRSSSERRRRKGREAGVAQEGESGERLGGDDSRVLTAVERTRTSPTHPYLLDEFDGDPLDYQWRVERSRLDAYHHAFWTDSNTRFEAAKRAVLSSLPESASPEMHEAALSEFYGHWLRQEQGRLKEYSDEWSRKNFAGIMLAARAAIRQFRARVFGGSSALSSPLPPPPPLASAKPQSDENLK